MAAPLNPICRCRIQRDTYKAPEQHERGCPACSGQQIIAPPPATTGSAPQEAKAVGPYGELIVRHTSDGHSACYGPCLRLFYEAGLAAGERRLAETAYGVWGGRPTTTLLTDELQKEREEAADLRAKLAEAERENGRLAKDGVEAIDESNDWATAYISVRAKLAAAERERDAALRRVERLEGDYEELRAAVEEWYIDCPFTGLNADINLRRTQEQQTETIARAHRLAGKEE